MSKIEEFIQQLCPNGVEYKELGEIVEILDSQRKPVSKSHRVGGEYPYYGANGIQDYVDDYIFDGTFILLGEDGSVINKDGSPVLNWATGKIWVNNHAHILAEKSDIAILRYVYFALETIDVTKVVKGNIPKITQQNLRGFQIPIPPLAIQQQIVSILDKFTKLQVELQTELQARSRQYNYYRNQLLNFEGKDIEWKMLGELCTIGDGLHGTPKYDDSGEYFFINGNNLDNGKISFDGKTKKVDDFMYQKYGIPFTMENTVFMSINGTIGSVSFYNNEKIVLGKSVAFFIIKSNCLNTRFLFYLLQSDFSKNYFEAQKTGSTIKNLGLKALRTFSIPIPPISEQVRIAGVLDKFDAMVNDLSVGLPAEIAARRKQYEYYRDRLLDFKNVSNG